MVHGMARGGALTGREPRGSIPLAGARCAVHETPRGCIDPALGTHGSMPLAGAQCVVQGTPCGCMDQARGTRGTVALAGLPRPVHGGGEGRLVARAWQAVRRCLLARATREAGGTHGTPRIACYS